MQSGLRPPEVLRRMQIISSWVNLHVISFYEPLLFFSLNTATDYSNFPAQIQVRFFQIIAKFSLRKSALLLKWNIFRIMKFQTIRFYLIYFTTLMHWSGRPPHSVFLRHVLLFSQFFHARWERRNRSSIKWKKQHGHLIDGWSDTETAFVLFNICVLCIFTTLRKIP